MSGFYAVKLLFTSTDILTWFKSVVRFLPFRWTLLLLFPFYIFHI